MYLIILGLLSILFCEESVAPIAGPYTTHVLGLETCKDEGTGQIKFDIKLLRLSRDKVVGNGTIFLGLPIDENTKVEVELQAWGNQGYRARFMTGKLFGCKEFFRYGSSLWKRFIGSTEKGPQKCPVLPGNLTVNQADVHNLVFDNLPVIAYKKWRCIVVFFYKGVKVGCVTAYTETLPLDPLQQH